MGNLLSKYGGAPQPEGCICELCLDISTNCRNMRNGFGYKSLSEIGFEALLRNKDGKN